MWVVLENLRGQEPKARPIRISATQRLGEARIALEHDIHVARDLVAHDVKRDLAVDIGQGLGLEQHGEASLLR